MRHRRKGRKLGRSPAHQRALLRSLVTNLFLTESEDEPDDPRQNAPKTRGRIVTTLAKAKEVRPMVEKCVTIARDALSALEEAEQFATDHDRLSEEWHAWRKSEEWQKWNQAIIPAVNARRRVISMLTSGKHAKPKDLRGKPDQHTKRAVEILFDEIAPRFRERRGGYTRILKLATVRLGDAGEQAILEFVGRNDRERQVVEEPQFDVEDDATDELAADEEAVEEKAEAADNDSAEDADESRES